MFNLKEFKNLDLISLLDDLCCSFSEDYSCNNLSCQRTAEYIVDLTIVLSHLRTQFKLEKDTHVYFEDALQQIKRNYKKGFNQENNRGMELFEKDDKYLN